jgi:hypothetical protein
LLKSDFDALWNTSFLAACLALAGKYVFRATKYLFLMLLRWYGAGLHQYQLAPAGDNLGHSRPRTVVEVLEASKGGRDLAKNTWDYVTSRHSQHKLFLLLIGAGCFTSFVAWVIVGVSVVHIQTDSAGLLSSKNCGVWYFDGEHAGDDAAARANVLARDKEARAGEYVRRCYGPYSGTSAVSPSTNCNFFYRPFIPFSNATTFKCPFPDSTVCAAGTPAISFDTGYVDAGEIGVNDGAQYKFRRTTTCVPLSIDEPYVRSELRNGTQTFYYQYGEIVDGDFGRNYTTSTSGNRLTCWRRRIM